MSSPGMEILISNCVPSYMRVNILPGADGLIVLIFNPVTSKGLNFKVPYCDGCISEESWIDIVVPKLNKAVEKLQMTELELQEEDE